MEFIQESPFRETVTRVRFKHKSCCFWASQMALVVKNKKLACQCRRCKRWGFIPWVGKIPWRKARQPTPVFLTGESHGQRSLVSYGSWSHHLLTKPPPPPCDCVLIQYVIETLTNGEERVNIPCGRIPNCLCGDSVWGSGDWAPLLRCGLVNSSARQEGKQEQLRGPWMRQAPLCQLVQGSIKDNTACG